MLGWTSRRYLETARLHPVASDKPQLAWNLECGCICQDDGDADLDLQVSKGDSDTVRSG